MADLVKDFWAGMPLGLYIMLLISAGLLIAGFVVPPLGVISPSVLKGAAILIGGTWLLYVTTHIPIFIERGAKIRAEYKGANIEIGKDA